MQRAIKFRAWDKKRGHFHWGIGNICLTLGGNLMWQFGFNAPDILGKDEAEDYVLQQYTGLKDKNGVEIFEGDIVLCPEWEDYDKGIMGQVKRTVRWDNSDACFAAFLKDEPDREGYLLDNACNMEVIGNINQNPELRE